MGRQVSEQGRNPQTGGTKQSHSADPLTCAKKLRRFDRRAHHAHRAPPLQMLGITRPQPLDLTPHRVLGIGPVEHAQRPLRKAALAGAIVNHPQPGVVSLLLSVFDRAAQFNFFAFQPLQKVAAAADQKAGDAARTVALDRAALQLLKPGQQRPDRQSPPSVCHHAHTDDRMQRVVHWAEGAQNKGMDASAGASTHQGRLHQRQKSR